MVAVTTAADPIARRPIITSEEVGGSRPSAQENRPEAVERSKKRSRSGSFHSRATGQPCVVKVNDVTASLALAALRRMADPWPGRPRRLPVSLTERAAPCDAPRHGSEKVLRQ